MTNMALSLSKAPMLISEARVAWVFEGMWEEVLVAQKKDRKAGIPNHNRGSGSGARSATRRSCTQALRAENSSSFEHLTATAAAVATREAQHGAALACHDHVSPLLLCYICIYSDLHWRYTQHTRL